MFCCCCVIAHGEVTFLGLAQAIRPVGFIMDKMTPSKRTGQVHGIVTPIPENELTEDFLVPTMLDLPVCKDLTADGLAETAKSTLNEFGILDYQVQGLGWDGEYVKKGVKKAFISKLNVECMNLRERDE